MERVLNYLKFLFIDEQQSFPSMNKIEINFFIFRRIPIEELHFSHPSYDQTINNQHAIPLHADDRPLQGLPL